jgi:osmotically-inducible protein OsmY
MREAVIRSANMKTGTQLKHDILEELKWDPEVDSAKVGVTVSDGAVTLTGHVGSYRQKMAARAVVKRIADVHALVDKIDVRLDREFSMTDEGLAERISHVLAWNVSGAGKGIKAEVKNGVVTLTGEVDWQYQRANIEKNIEHVGGVVSVVDRIDIKPRAATPEVQKRISEALKRHAEAEALKITIAASDGTIVLSGTVESLAEKDRVENAAWAAPGVTKVVDNLRVA